MKKNIYNYIDEVSRDRMKKVVIWGAGKTAGILCELTELKKRVSLQIVDEIKTGDFMGRYRLKKPQEIDFTKVDVVIVSPMSATEKIIEDLKAEYCFCGEIIKIYGENRQVFIYEQEEFCIYIHNLYKKRLDELKKKNVIKIGYIATQNELWNLDSFYREIEKEKRFQFEVIALPNHENTLESKEISCNTNYDFFRKNNINVTYGYDFEKDRVVSLEKWEYDILFWDQPGAWSGILKDIPFYEFISKFFLCYVPYGYKVADGKQNHFDLYYHNLSWKIFAESEWHLAQFRAMGKLKGKNVVATGFPKLDSYLDDSRDYSNWKNGSKLKKRIIWAPHWTVRNPGFQYSTFDRYYLFFLEYATKHSEIDWIVKPHQRLYFWCVDSGLMTESEMRNYFERWNSLENAVVCDGGNYMDIFMTSDALITDCGSFLAEYLPTKKPIIHLYNEESKYNEIGNKIIQSYYRCSSSNDIKNFIQRVVLEDDDYLKERRMAVLKYVVPNKEGAGISIINELRKELNSN